MEENQKHSRLGIASFTISVAVALLFIVLLVAAAMLSGGHIDRGEPYPGQAIVGLSMIGLFAVDIGAVGLGIASVCQSARKRIFGILGLVFSGLTILGGGGLIVIGLFYAMSVANR